MEAKTIEEVIVKLDEIIEESYKEKTRFGYFASLYRLVTVTVRDKIQEGDYFQDNERMEKLDVIFANRYIVGYYDFKEGKADTLCWELSFKGVASGRYIILQQLLSAMNAHINLDLGIACAEVAPGDKIDGLYEDFVRINVLLASLVGTVQGDIDELSPWIGWIDQRSRGLDEAIVNWSVKKARDFAWELAKELAAAPNSEKDAIITKRDEKALKFGKKVLSPGFFPWVLIMLIRWKEVKDPQKIIETLADKKIEPEKIEALTRKYVKETRSLTGK